MNDKKNDKKTEEKEKERFPKKVFPIVSEAYIDQKLKSGPINVSISDQANNSENDVKSASDNIVEELRQWDIENIK